MRGVAGLDVEDFVADAVELLSLFERMLDNGDDDVLLNSEMRVLT